MRGVVGPLPVSIRAELLVWSVLIISDEEQSNLCVCVGVGGCVCVGVCVCVVCVGEHNYSVLA